MIILEEVTPPHLWCTRCDMLVPWASLNGRHPNTAKYAKGVNHKRHSLATEEMRVSTEQVFQEYVCPLTLVSSFKYLGRVLAASYDD